MSNTFGEFVLLLLIIIVILIFDLVYVVLFLRYKNKNQLKIINLSSAIGLLCSNVLAVFHFYNYLLSLKTIITLKGERYNITTLLEGFSFNYDLLYIELVLSSIFFLILIYAIIQIKKVYW